MALNRQRSEEGRAYEYETGLNTNSTDTLAAISSLTSGTGGTMLIRTLQRLIEPIFVPIFRPLIRQLIRDEIELAKQEFLISIKENSENEASSSGLKKLKLQFRNKIALPVFTGMPLLGDNKTPIEIALVDALSDQIVNTGVESTAELEILGLRVGDDDGSGCDDDEGSWTYKNIQERILSERKGRRILQGDTRLQLKEGVGFVHRISFTHSAEHTRNGMYRLVAVVVDAALMNGVEMAWTETFFMKDRRCTYHEKHLRPLLSDKVCHLQQISYKGTRYRRLRDAKVYTVNDLLRLLYTDKKRLEDILELKASSKFWDDIVKNAQASNGMFLYFNPRNGLEKGVVFDAKLQLKAVIIEPHRYIAVNQLSEQQKVETQDMVKFASEHFDMLRAFDHETSLKEHLQSSTSSPSVGMIDGPPRPSSQVIKSSHGVNNSSHKPFVSIQSERGKEKVPFEDEMIPSADDYQGYVPYGLNFGTSTEAGTCSQVVESLLDTCELMNIFDNSPILEGPQFDILLKDVHDILNQSPNECQSNPAIISLCDIARARWTKVSKLLRRNSVRERISLSQGIQPLKKQRCC